MNDSLTKRDSVSTSARRRDGVSQLPWAIYKRNEMFAEIMDADDRPIILSEFAAMTNADAAYIVEAVNERQSDEALIASLLYHHLEDFAEAVASDGFTKVVKAAFKRLGLKYEPFGPDAFETVEQRMKDGAR